MARSQIVRWYGPLSQACRAFGCSSTPDRHCWFSAGCLTCDKMGMHPEGLDFAIDETDG